MNRWLFCLLERNREEVGPNSVPQNIIRKSGCCSMVNCKTSVPLPKTRRFLNKHWWYTVCQNTSTAADIVNAQEKFSLTLSFLLALNFFRQSTVSCLCIIEATVERCWRGGERADTSTYATASSILFCVTWIICSEAAFRCQWKWWSPIPELQGWLF